MARQGAQNQHYVPKFILRKFLANPAKEQVSVFQKSTGRTFLTNIDNIMAERRFSEFRMDEKFVASFEDSFCRVEEAVLPTYEEAVDKRRLRYTSDEQAMLGFFVAFQMVRTRQYRDGLSSMTRQLREKIHSKFMGDHHDPDELLDMLDKKDGAKFHLEAIGKHMSEFAAIIAQKNFTLIAAPKGHSFYLGDNPVVLHNSVPNKGWGSNLGLSIKGIEIYVPLSAKYTLAAYCPSIIGEMRAGLMKSEAIRKRAIATKTLAAEPLTGRAKVEFNAMLEEIDKGIRLTKSMIASSTGGAPVVASRENMRFYNGLQVEFAREFVVCPRSDFALAEEVVATSGADSGGPRFTVE